MIETENGDYTQAAPTVTADTEGCFQNRELSWLKFNERVLDEAGNPDVPPAERLSFIAIYQNNLDEFFMVRVGTLMVQMNSDEEIRENKTNMTAREQVQAILESARAMDIKRGRLYQALMRELESFGIRILNFNYLSPEDAKMTETWFDTQVAPFLTPILVSGKQVFPFLANKETYACAILAPTKKGKDNKDAKQKIGIVSCKSSALERLIPIPGRPGTYILAEDLILHFMQKLFPGFKVIEKSLLRVTRNADITPETLYDEDLSFRDVMVKLVKERPRLDPVRLEFTRQLSVSSVNMLCKAINIDPEYVFFETTPADLSFMFQLRNALRKRPEMLYPKWAPIYTMNSKASIIDQVFDHDVLLEYPFDSMKPLIDMLHEAAHREDVVSIRMTLYRVASHSKIVEALADAAENGKNVVVVDELRARFDEENNIEMSHVMEDSGCHVYYGPTQYKVHSKLCLIQFKDGSFITQIGTGNYNEKTAQQYTDLCLMTANRDIAKDALAVFVALEQGEVVDHSSTLLISPKCLKNKVIMDIDAEAERAKHNDDAYIGIKINSLTDREIIEHLIAASQAGVTIEMVVRGICCIVPGIPGKTDHIQVVSVVGRYLEHSRIYRFGKGDREKIYISSADFMTRNTERRVEAGVPILDPTIRARVDHIFDTVFHDNVNGRLLRPDGEYSWRQDPLNPIDSQRIFADEAANALTEQIETPVKAAEPRPAEPAPAPEEHHSWFYNLFHRK